MAKSRVPTTDSSSSCSAPAEPGGAANHSSRCRPSSLNRLRQSGSITPREGCTIRYRSTRAAPPPAPPRAARTPHYAAATAPPALSHRSPRTCGRTLRAGPGPRPVSASRRPLSDRCSGPEPCSAGAAVRTMRCVPWERHQLSPSPQRNYTHLSCPTTFGMTSDR